MLAYIVFGLFSLLGLFMMFIILLQRGRGGGLAGAFGGAGGQSAFGTRAGDVFTKITVVVAILWVAMACASIYAFRAASESGPFKNNKVPKEQPGMISTDDETGDKSSSSVQKDFTPENKIIKESKPPKEDSNKSDTKKTDTPVKEEKPENKPKKEVKLQGEEKIETKIEKKPEVEKKKETGPTLIPPSQKTPEKPANIKKK